MNYMHISRVRRNNKSEEKFNILQKNNIKLT